MKQIEIEIDGIIYKTFVRDNEEISLTVEETHYDDEFMDGHGFGFNDRHRRNQREEYEVFPPITGKVVGIIPVGTKIKKGDVVATIEAMKMYNRIFSPVKGIVKEVHYSVGDNAVRSTSLVIIEKK
ncbi:MAG: acetyl-CoA carboxylase biotin carboxyl carrier protein subunit [Paludibacteraceae bacterium]|nr:acetyl-CoA carboxylase biotin carboxyl carrier protein subunit [Paludibacteraceae bacterium]MBP5525441.1 acetyl-CoA carboxylase biotin carboxyl carrier protein subunit [Paludibacteraceae bacterium]MCR5248561.1 acetyl-CoA carboxylase biotin carboxyl carrier protein subunit [Paludibacteraceae bacterium]